MNTHRLDLFSLVAGLATVAVAVVLIVPDLDIQTVWDFLPVLLVIAGLAMLVSSLRRSSADPSTDTAPKSGARHDTGERPDGDATTDLRPTEDRPDR